MGDPPGMLFFRAAIIAETDRAQTLAGFQAGSRLAGILYKQKVTVIESHLRGFSGFGDTVVGQFDVHVNSASIIKTLPPLVNRCDQIGVLDISEADAAHADGTTNGVIHDCCRFLGGRLVSFWRRTVYKVARANLNLYISAGLGAGNNIIVAGRRIGFIKIRLPVNFSLADRPGSKGNSPMQVAAPHRGCLADTDRTGNRHQG